MKKTVNEGLLDAIKAVGQNVASRGTKKYAPKLSKSLRNNVHDIAKTQSDKKKMTKMTNVMYKQYRSHVDKLTKAGEPAGVKAFNEWLTNFMAPREVDPFTGIFTPGSMKKHIKTLVDTYYRKDSEEPVAHQSSRQSTQSDPKYAQDDTSALTKHLDKKDNRRADAGLDGQAMKASGADAGLKNIKIKSKMAQLRKRLVATADPKLRKQLGDKLEQLADRLTKESLQHELMNAYLKEDKYNNK